MSVQQRKNVIRGMRISFLKTIYGHGFRKSAGFRAIKGIQQKKTTASQG